ncbi:MAG: serine/threonine-protein kinase [Kofleriaceae bacterium]|nr:serine/threonine-protein kinase [Kofleriaceae bacterium]
MTCPTDEELARVVDGTANADERARVLAHVDECGACLQALAGAAASDQQAAPVPAVGDRLGRFTITGVLGVGAMGVVYEARDPELERVVALKLLRGDRDLSGEEAVTSLRAEARSLARVTSPHVVAVHDIGAAGGHVFIAMERIAGVTLRVWLDARTPALRDIVGAFVQAGRGLAAAHDAGVVHRDFKPANVLVGDDGRVRVGDFGLARRQAIADGVATSPDGAVSTHSVAGTPAYMAPEQLRGEPVTQRSDQYSFCVALAEAVTGTRPERGATKVANRAGIPDRLAAAIERGLAADPAARWPEMAALVAALEPWAGPGRLRARIGLGVGLGIAALAGAAITLRATAREPAPRCDDGEQSIAELWLPARSAQLAKVLGDGAHAEIARNLTRFSSRWASTSNLVCKQGRAARAGAAQCLAVQRTQADELVRGIATLTPTQVDIARGAILALPDPDRCLREGATVSPLPIAMSFEKRLAEVRAEHELGKTKEAKAHAIELVAQTHALGLRSIELRARILHGRTEEILDAKAAIGVHLEASTLALELGDDWSLVDTWNGLVHAHTRLGRHDVGELLFAQANALLVRLGGDPARAAALALGLCIGGWQRGPDFTAARTACAAARKAILADGNDPDDVRTTWVATEEANIAVMSGRYDEAIATYQANVAYRTRRKYRPDHHANLADRNNWGIALVEAKRYREAIAHLTDFVALAPDALDAWNYLATSHKALGDGAGALAAAKRALAIVERGTDVAALCAKAVETTDYAIAAGNTAAARAIAARVKARCTGQSATKLAKLVTSR